MRKRRIIAVEAKSTGDALRIRLDNVDLKQFRRGLEVEFEHALHDPETNVTNDDELMTGKIA